MRTHKALGGAPTILFTCRNRQKLLVFKGQATEKAVIDDILLQLVINVAQVPHVPLCELIDWRICCFQIWNRKMTNHLLTLCEHLGTPTWFLVWSVLLIF